MLVIVLVYRKPGRNTDFEGDVVKRTATARFGESVGAEHTAAAPQR